jgi:dolichol-phosphate mannosyltransferase
MTASIYPLQQPDWQVPAFTAESFKPREHKFAICIPVINEGERIRTQLRKMRYLTAQADIIIADGGSTDGSLDIDFLKEMNIRTLLTKKGAGKLSAQMRMAMAYCLQEGYKGTIFLDGNNKDDASAIPQFIQKLEEGYDHVQGSRYIPGGVAINTPVLRHWGLKLLHAPLISLSAGFPYTDTTNGFRGYSARFLADPKVNPFRDVFPEYELHYYLAIRAPRLGYRTIEVPVTRAYPKGKVPSKISPFKGYIKIFNTLLKATFQVYNPH